MYFNEEPSIPHLIESVKDVLANISDISKATFDMSPGIEKTLRGIAEGQGLTLKELIEELYKEVKAEQGFHPPKSLYNPSL